MTCRVFLLDGQLWSERHGPARNYVGQVNFDCCGRGPPDSSPDGWPLAAVDSDVCFHGLCMIDDSAGLAWAGNVLYAWGSGQCISDEACPVRHTPEIIWRATTAIHSVAAADRALLIILVDGRLFGRGNCNWGACNADDSGWKNIALPEGKRAMRVQIRPYCPDTRLWCTDGSCFTYDHISSGWRPLSYIT